MSEPTPAAEAQPQSSPAIAEDAKRASVSAPAPVAAEAAAPSDDAKRASVSAAPVHKPSVSGHGDSKDAGAGGSLAGSGGAAIKEAVPHAAQHDVDNSGAINANCTAAWLGKAETLKDAKEHCYEVGVVVLDGVRHALFHVPDGADKNSKDRKPYRLLPLNSIVEPPAPAKVVVNPDESYYDEPKIGETHKPLPQHFAYWRAPVFYAAAAGRKDVVETLISRHRDAAADRARVYTAKKKGESQWEIVENAAENATTPKPKFVDAAAVARANGFEDVALALDKSYRACSTEDCTVM